MTHGKSLKQSGLKIQRNSVTYVYLVILKRKSKATLMFKHSLPHTI